MLCVEANILLAKLYYSQMRLDEASSIFNTENLQSIINEHIASLKKQQKSGGDPLQCVNASTLRQLQIFAEGHSIKGFYKIVTLLNFASNFIDYSFKAYA